MTQQDLPEPLVPAEIDLRPFKDMPLEVGRLLMSEMAKTRHREVLGDALMAWAVAWHQVPAGSLPDDDEEIAELLRYGVKGVRIWKRKREKGALNGFIKCSDGRLYHPVVCEKALESWNKLNKNTSRTEAARRARAAKNHGRSGNLPMKTKPGISVTEATTDSVVTPKGMEGNGIEGKEVAQQRSPESVAPREEPPPPEQTALLAAQRPRSETDPPPLEPGAAGDVALRLLKAARMERQAQALAARPENLIVLAQPVCKWLAAGLTVDQIEGAIRAVAARESYKPPTALAYFDRPVMELKEAPPSANGQPKDPRFARWGAITAGYEDAEPIQPRKTA